MTKQEAMSKMCEKAAMQPFRTHEYRNIGKEEDKQKFIHTLTAQGRFSDLGDSPDDAVQALQRLAFLSEDYHWKLGIDWPEGLKSIVLSAAKYYCKIEADREDMGASRFHQSIFRFPVASLNLFFMLYPDMERGEAKPKQYPLEAGARREILRVAYQTFSLPVRNDETDKNPVSVERFQKHVWWIGGNALTYRPVLYTALAFKSIDMMQVIAQVAACSICAVSQAVIEDAFWQEGICADGFGWGHGKQAYNSGYPTDGLNEALNILSYIVGTPFEDVLEYADFSKLISYIRGITWSAYGSFSAPMQTRNIFLRDKSKKKTMDELAVHMAEYLANYFSAYLTEEERREVDMLLERKLSLEMTCRDGLYKGVRYFWNNDDLIKKNKGFYFYVNMASSRCDGVEFADIMADKRNYYTADGSYTVLVSGKEYEDVMGTWQVAHLPGVTERFIPNSELLTETNWHGYRSKFNFAAGVSIGENGLCGFIYEKDEIREPDGAGVIRKEFTVEMCGIQAYKSYFIIEDTIYCLGAGICDIHPEHGREVHTTVNNTLLCNDTEPVEKDGYVFIENDKILYGIRKQENSKICITKEKRKTAWEDLNYMNEGEKEEEYPVFEIIVDHGENPQNASYEYFMCINHKKYENVMVLENSKRLQAVSKNDFSVVEGVFFDSEKTLKMKDIEITVSQPCALLLQQEEDGYRIAVCDAEQKPELKEVIVTVIREGHDKQEVVIKMPDGLFRGKQGEGFYSYSKKRNEL
ncbi:polysaccharide lyase 8 family protein [Lachnoclostridium phytofermentans]|uniref:Polysaccharide lyase family 8 n=1 Tax=Lachnoclostridium phytofermentans (strain ATCC 700394 / DSM 18823 / ISDg) TaxID=357809 RepID=A9KLI7_LACP7|nr:polysaccharide lyase 8 family protein [Lachnoclostridium phytofermentans]ABX41316.1 polysaccharide lyase family 8 [Lachnoclostridium phytofermentans ISDg]